MKISEFTVDRLDTEGAKIEMYLSNLEGLSIFTQESLIYIQHGCQIMLVHISNCLQLTKSIEPGP